MEGCLSLGEGAKERSLVVLQSAVQHQGALHRSVCPGRGAAAWVRVPRRGVWLFYIVLSSTKGLCTGVCVRGGVLQRG